jgi:hypothetical protein
MRKTQRIRLHKVQDLAKKHGGTLKFSAMIDRSPSQVSQFSGKRPSRSIGDALARHIEESLDLPDGWLDDEAPEDVTPPTPSTAIG